MEFDRFQGFVELYSDNLSLGGMFVSSESLPPIGSEVSVEFRLGDGFELIRGRGRVVWVREVGDEPAGFGIRFLELTPGSRELIFRLVERRVREGEPVFDIDETLRAESTGDAATEVALSSPPWDLPGQRGGEEPRSPSLPVTGAAADDHGGAESPRFGRAVRESGEVDTGAGRAAAPDRGSPATGPEREESFAGLADAAAAPLSLSDEQLGADERPDVVQPGPGPSEGGSPPSVDEGGALSLGLAAEPAADREAALVDPTADGTTTSGWPWSATEETERSQGPGDERAVEEGLSIDGAGDGGRELAPAAVTEGAPSESNWPWATPLPEPPGPTPSPEEAPEEAVAASDRFATISDGDEGPVTAAGSRRRHWWTIAAVGLTVVALGLLLLLRTSAAPDRQVVESPSASPGETVTPVTPVASPGGDAGDLSADVETGAGLDATAAEPDLVEGVAEAVEESAGGGPRIIERIAWERRGRGVEFLIAGAGAIPAAGFDHFRVGGGQPRLVVRIAGVERPYARGTVEVGGPLVERVRTGLHPAAGGSGPGSLHLVFDLVPPGTAVASVESTGGRLRVRLEEP